MIHIEKNSSGSALDLDYVRDVEEEIEMSFPTSFIEFMRKHNGGIPLEKYLEIGELVKVVERFLSFVPDYKTNDIGVYDIEVVWSQIEGRLNDNVCPFAALFAGDFLCFDFQNEEEPKVVLWDHEKSEEGLPHLIEVADSFDGCLMLLHS